MCCGGWMRDVPGKSLLISPKDIKKKKKVSLGGLGMTSYPRQPFRDLRRQLQVGK